MENEPGEREEVEYCSLVEPFAGGMISKMMMVPLGLLFSLGFVVVDVGMRTLKRRSGSWRGEIGGGTRREGGGGHCGCRLGGFVSVLCSYFWQH